MFTWALTYLVHSTILIGAVWIVSRWIRSAFTRDLLWKLALAGGIVTATIQMIVPFDRTASYPAPHRIEVTLEETVQLSQPSATVTTQARLAGAPARIATFPATRPWSTRTILTLFWAIGSFLLLTRIVLGCTRLSSLLRDRRDILIGEDRDLLEALCAAAGYRRVVRLTQSDAVASPLAMIGSEIVVPRTIFSSLTIEQKQSILAHELAHLMRRDPAWLTLCEVIRSVLFFQPLNWMIPSKLKQTAEFICDDAAVQHTGNPKALAETLAELAATIPTPYPLPVAAMAEGGSQLVTRVRRVLSEHSDRPLRLFAQLLIAAFAIVLVTGFAPGMSFVDGPDSLLPGPESSVERPTSSVPRPASERIEDVSRTGDAGRGTEDVQPATRQKSAPDKKPKSDERVVARFGHITLNQSFTGPNGETKVNLEAADGELALDPFRVSFTGPGGFLRATERSEHGPVREVDVRADTAGAPVYRYLVDGEEREWSRDAERVIAANFIKARAYATADPASPARESRPQKWHTWNAHVHLTGTRDGIPTELNVRVTDVQFTDDGQVRFNRGSSVLVEEKLGENSRSFSRTADQVLWSRSSRDGIAVPDEEWVVGLLVKHNKVPPAVARAIARE